MQKTQAVGLNKRAVVRFLLLLLGFALAGALLLWLKAVATNVLSLSLPTELQDLITLALSIVVEALPFVILGALVSVIVRLFAPTQRILRLLPKRPLLRRLSISLFGTFMPVCECGNVPVARGLVIRGLSVAESTTFLLAAPIINPVTLLATSQAFRLDPSIVWIRMAGGLLIANLLGGLIAGATQVFVPRDVLTSLGSDPFLSILAMIALAFIISICANVDAFFALAYSNTFTIGSIVAFLVFGPMIDIKMLTMMRTTYKVRLLAVITLLVTLTSILIGLVVNYAL